MTDEEWGQWFALMEWDEQDLDKFLDRQESKWGGNDDEEDWTVHEDTFGWNDHLTKEDWLEWANSMQWDRAEWEEYA